MWYPPVLEDPTSNTPINYCNPADLISQLQYAGFWRRCGALLIDIMIFNPPLRVVELVWPSGAGWAIIVAWWIYVAGCESSPIQGTIGKLALRIYVTDLGGQRISFVRASLRHFSRFASLILLSAGFMMAGRTKQRQALHDIMTGCLVVRREKDSWW